MVFEVCALVLTIIFGMLGIYLLIVVRSTQRLVDEARQSVVLLNKQLPDILADVQSSVQGIKTTTEALNNGVQQVAAGVELVARSPVTVATGAINTLRKGIEIWQRIRHKDTGSQVQMAQGKEKQ